MKECNSKHYLLCPLPPKELYVGVQKLLFVSKCAVLKELHVLQQRMIVCSCTESLYSVCGAAALKIILTGSRVLCIREMNLFRKFIFNVCFLEIKNLLWAIFLLERCTHVNETCKTVQVSCTYNQCKIIRILQSSCNILVLLARCALNMATYVQDLQVLLASNVQ